jgi:competence protein ComEC
LRKLVLLSCALVTLLSIDVQFHKPALAASGNIVINKVELNQSGRESEHQKIEFYDPFESHLGDWKIISTTTGMKPGITLDPSTDIQRKGYFVIAAPSQSLANSNEGILPYDEQMQVVDSQGPFSDAVSDNRMWQKLQEGSGVSSRWHFQKDAPNGSNSGLDKEPQNVTLSSTISQLQAIGTGSTKGPDTGSTTINAPSKDPELKIVFIDVGQGDSTLMIFPNGKTMLIDASEPDKGSSILAVLEQMNVTRIHAIVATHPHADHIGGLISVMNRISVDKVIDSGQDYTTNTYFDYLDAIDRNKIPFSVVHDGDKIDLDQSVKIEVLNPPNPLISKSDDNISNNSVVLRMTYGNFSILFPGDVKEAGEEILANKDLKANVLLAAHHGSGHSNSMPFLSAVKPETVVIYAGANNQYGFPSQKALNNFNSVGVKHLFRTDLDGSIILTTDGRGEYTMRTLGSERTIVVVPEFNNVLLITSIVLLTLVIIYKKKMLYGRTS